MARALNTIVRWASIPTNLSGRDAQFPGRRGGRQVPLAKATARIH